MASYFLPSFLTGWEFPSLSAYSLSTALQKRLLSFLLKRTLGHLVVGGQLDLAQIDAGIGSGKIEIRNVQLDSQAINKQIASLPIKLVHGQLGSIAIQIPLPNIWNGDLSLTLSDVTAHVTIPDDLDLSQTTADFHESLAASFASAASSILENDTEAIELEQSLQQTIIQETVQLSDKDKDEVEEGSLLSSYVQNLLARLKVTLQNIQVDFNGSKHGLKLVLKQINFQTSPNPSPLPDQPTQNTASDSSIDQIVRVVELQGIELWSCGAGQKLPHSSDSSSSSSSSVDHSDSSDSAPRSDVGPSTTETISQIQANHLSESFLSQSSASLYQSALQDRSDINEAQSPMWTHDEDDIQLQLPSSFLLFSIGHDPVTVMLTICKHRQQLRQQGFPNRFRVKSIDTRIQVDLNYLAFMVQPHQLPAFLSLAKDFQTINHQLQAQATSSAPPSNTSGKRASLSVNCNIKAVHAICMYEGLENFPNTQAKKILESIDAYWSRPARVHPEIGHLRMRIEGVRFDMATSSEPTRGDVGDHLTLTFSDLSIYERLPPSLTDQLTLDIPKILPIVILDHNLAQTADSSTSPSTTFAESGHHHSRSRRNDISCLPLESIDWRLAPGSLAANASSAPVARTPRFSQEQRSTCSSAPNPYLRTAYGEKGWKMKPRARPYSNSFSDTNDMSLHALSISVKQRSTGNQRNLNVFIAPAHVFLDISIVSRLLPLLTSLAADLSLLSLNSQVSGLASSTATISANTARAAQPESSLLDDLQDTRDHLPTYVISIKTETLRLEVRVPQSTYRDESISTKERLKMRRLGLETRSGLLIVDISKLDAQLGTTLQERSARVVHFANLSNFPSDPDSDDCIVSRISTARIAVFLKPSNEPRPIPIACIQGMQDNSSDSFGQLESPLLPRITVSSGKSKSSSAAKQTRCHLPLFQLSLGKQTIDTLQFLADDLTQWLSIWSAGQLDDSDLTDNEGLKILGSRFFGSRAAMSILSSSTDSTSTARNPTKQNSSLGLDLSEIIIDLKIPAKQDPDKPHRIGVSRDLRLSGSELKLRIEPSPSLNTTSITTSILTFSLKLQDDHPVDEQSQGNIVCRTMEPGLTQTVRPMIAVKIQSYSEPGTSYRESNIDISTSSITLSPPLDPDLMVDFLSFVKAPEGVFEHVEPNEVTRIHFKARDCSIFLVPANTTARAALALGEVSVKTKLTSHAPRTGIKLAIANANLFVIETCPNQADLSNRSAKSASEFWSSLGFSRIVNISDCKGGVTLNSLTLPDIDVKITKIRSKVQLCADTIGVLVQLASKFQPPSSAQQDTRDQGPSNQEERSASSSPVSQGFNVLDDIDDNIFRKAAPIASVADLVDDDVPSDPKFLGETGRYHPKIVESVLETAEFFGGESVASLSIDAPASNHVTFADQDVTIRILDPNGIRPVAEYFTDPDLKPHVASLIESSASTVRVRVSDLDFSLRLHSGYDWQTTRSAVENEAKRVKKRLQKIKQILAEGQVPDDSVEEATSHLLESVHMILPQDPSEMDPSEMIRAMDEELGNHSDTTSVTSNGTWQTLPSVRGSAKFQRDQRSRQRSKLERSFKSMIDFNFRGVEIELDLLDPLERHLASRVALTVRSFEIIDNIKTSTWHAFLTRMKEEESAFRRDSEAKMIRVELLNVKTVHESDHNQEVRVRAGILPLRLHVDQDALDFLKKFFAFRLPGTPPPPAEGTPPASLPFIQYAEIHPIKLKLDYKPKRVNYDLLRQGKTIELMNFFHFEDAEMTLRHITLRGISGWPRLFDTLNDIWTPDVKANQLADVLSGVAPIRSLVNVGAGLADLVLLPIEQYQKDGRLIRGVQRGTTSFAKTTALEAVRLGARLATGTQVILEQAELILGGRISEPLRGEAIGSGVGSDYAPQSLSSGSARGHRRRHLAASAHESLDGFGLDSSLHEGDFEESEKLDEKISKYADQPEDMREALTQAYKGLSRGLTSAAQTILAVPMEVYEDEASNSGTTGGVARPFVRAVPIAILRGARGATEAVARTMLGVQAQLGDNSSTDEGKYKKASSSSSSSKPSHRY